MNTLRVAAFEDSFVIHFGGEFARINAYTLATTLVNLADAAKAANASINPGYEIEIVVEALGAGSFRTKIRTLYESADNLFSKDSLRVIVLSVIAAFIYQHTLAPTPNVEVHVGVEEVVIEQGDTRVVVPRHVHDAVQHLQRNPDFMKGISQVFRAAEEDEHIVSIGFSPDYVEGPTPIEIPRERFSAIPALADEEDGTSRELDEVTDLEILRAILERSRRRWEFVWNGMTISAPVTDDQFYDDFFAHRITIAPGDALRVRLRVHQRRLPDVGIFVNEGYEVVEVLRHLPRAKQPPLPR
jgi:hypothetical protein